MLEYRIANVDLLVERNRGKTITTTNVSVLASIIIVNQGGQLVVWLRFRPVDRRVAGSIPESSNFLTNSFGQATNALVSLFTKQ